jgi:hypothetical protein
MLTSGYTEALLSAQHELPQDLIVLRKPYRQAELARSLQLVIRG